MVKPKPPPFYRAAVFGSYKNIIPIISFKVNCFFAFGAKEDKKEKPQTAAPYRGLRKTN